MLRSFLKRNQGVWFGWSGRTVPKGEEAVREVEHSGVTYITTDISRGDFQEFYNGFANRMLWPILHYRLDLVEFSSRDMAGYLRVNEMFADRLQSFLKPDDVIWVHDYHFLPLAKALRERGVENKIGFFLHIPFPPPDILTALPKHERTILSLCHYDLVGFQTDNDADNLADYLTNECRMPSRDRRTFIAGQRTMRIGVFPVGVETAEFERLARRTQQADRGARGGAAVSPTAAMIIGVDRLDYSKGIGMRMRAFEQFLTDYPRWRGARDLSADHAAQPLRHPRIRRHGAADRRDRRPRQRPLRRGGLDADPLRQPLVQPHRAGGTLSRRPAPALVTPLRDGMNLVAKEYVAAQDPEDPGVLILSRFAGAAVECQAALLVNPYDQEAVAAAIDQALSMPLEERKARHSSMVKVLSENDIKDWGTRFIAALTRPAPVAAVPQAAGAGPYLAAAE